MATTRSLSRYIEHRPRLAAVALVLALAVVGIVVGVAMAREEPNSPEFPLVPGMERVATGSMPIPMLGLGHEDARSAVYTAPVTVPELYRFYSVDVLEQGWDLASGVEDAQGSAVVYLVRFDSVAIVQILDASVALGRRIAENPRLNLQPADIEGAATVVIVGRFECTDESGTAVCLDYITERQ
jgi:hypothetical protein